ncbi:hypothetical protein OpiT1DRAFT_03537 [Opitutaceae bacterium TAV1]|nr:hypothetical protein OpiT1DRAFT_03537 [Opitutaceae bacterium TAV1]
MKTALPVLALTDEMLTGISARKILLRDEDASRFTSSPAGDAHPDGPEGNDRLGRLHQVLAGTGDFAVRTTDGQMEVRFSAVGDPDNLLVEFFPCNRSENDMGRSSGGMCALADAGRLLDSICRGADSASLLLSTPAMLRVPDAA